MQVVSFGIPNAPDAELSRSHPTARCGRLAQKSGLLLAHFEHRVHLPLPEHWEPADRPDLGEAQIGWQAGVLHEPKYRSFQLDRRIGSLHPGYRAKWTGHELCHGLVGFAWAPGKSRLWHATAARLSELLPVVLYYFLDEVGLHRCPLHRGSGPLYRSFCAACEKSALDGPIEEDPEADRWIGAGRRFLDRELAAVARTRRLGSVVPHHHATLDLSSDGLAYVAGHHARLCSDAFARYISLFFKDDGSWHKDLDALSARVESLFAALAGEARAEPLKGNRIRWMAQDLGWRVMLVMEQAEGEVVAELEKAVLQPLVEAEARGEGAFIEAAHAYRALHDEWVLPSPEELFSTGYDLPGGLGRSETQVAAGIQSALPATWALLGERADDLAGEFTWEDGPLRRPIGRRFARWLSARGEEAAAEQAAFEAAITHARPASAMDRSLGADSPADARLRLAGGVEVLRVHHAVTTDPDAVEEQGGISTLDEPLYLVVMRAPDGEVEVVQLSEGAGPALHRLGTEGSLEREELGLAEAEIEELLSIGVVVPEAWKI